MNMGKRLFRIFAKEIPSKIHTLTGTELNLVLQNKKTYHGRILNTEGGEVVLQDFLHGMLRFRISDITEVVYDKESAF